MDFVQVLAPAKINLGLSILAKRSDGYHEIRTFFQKVTLFDEITIRRNPFQSGISLTIDDPSVPSDGSNLAAQAAALLMRDCGIDCGITIHIKKRIPIGAGLGGGSSNAAATLLGINCLFNLNFSEETLRQRAVQLGADVPFFVMSAPTAYAAGIGEQLTPVQMRVPFWTLIVFPNIPIATAWAYATWSKYNSLTKREKHIKYIASFDTLEDVVSNLWNDFEQVVFPAYPQIQQLRDRLLNCGARGALLSGSGSSVFGVFESYAACASAHKVLGNEVGLRLFIAQTVPQS